MRPRAAAVLLFVASAWAGCAAPEPSDGDVPLADALQWPDLTVHVTPGEPFEIPQPIRLTWQGDIFAIASQGEPDLRDRTIVSGETVYANNVPGMGWVHFARTDPAPANSPRITLFDLPRVLGSPHLAVTVHGDGGVLNLTAEGTVDVPGGVVPLRLQVGARDGVVVWARMESDAAMEAPFTFVRDGAAFPFEPVPPAESRTLQDAATRNGEAHRAHIRIIRLVQNYTRSHAGLVPDEPSPDSLRLELLTSGHSWPDNAFTGGPMRARDEPGHFGWQKRGPREATYTGWGWDGALVTQTFRS